MNNVQSPQESNLVIIDKLEWNDELDKELEEIDREIEKFNEEFDKDWEQLKQISITLDKMFNVVDFNDKLEKKYLEFNSNIEQVNKLLNSVSEEDKFALGLLLTNYFSVFEGFIHDFFHILIKAEENVDNKGIINKTNQHQKRTKKAHASFDDILKDYESKTLNSPSKILSILNQIFNMNITYDEQKIQNFDKLLIAKRNTFAHNNGYINNIFQKIKMNELMMLRDFLIKLVTILRNKLINNFETHFNEIEKNSILSEINND